MTDENTEIKDTVRDIFGTMASRLNPESAGGVTARLGYVITGQGGGEWTVSLAKGEVEILQGLRGPDATVTVSAEDFVALNLGKLDGMTAFSSGRLRVEGDAALLGASARLFKKYAPRRAAGEPGQPPEELIRLKQVLSIPHRFATGPVMGRFLKALADRRILANKCPSCGRLQLPPREICAECRVRVETWVEVGPEGVVANYDVAYYASPDPLTGESRETPYCVAYLILDGCRQQEVFWHELKPADIPKIRKGARVRPVWSRHRTGAITDIQYFEIID